MRISILTASYGKGHDQAAKLLKAAAEAQNDEAVIHRPFEECGFPTIFRASKTLYHTTLFFLPGVWRSIAAHQQFSSRWWRMLSFIYRKPLEQALDADLVMSVHPILTALAGEIKKDSPVPVYSVATDYWNSSLSAHSNINGLFVTKAAPLPHVNHGQAVIPAGIPTTAPKKLLSKKECSLKNGWDPKKPLILISGGGEGLFPFRSVYQELKKLSIPSTIVQINGKKSRAKHKKAGIHDLYVLPFTEHFRDYLHAAELLISKAGGMTMTEAVMEEVPVIIYSPLPGHEEQNALCMIKHKAASWVTTPREVRKKAEQLLDDPWKRVKIKRRLKRMQEPNSAEIIVTIAKQGVEQVSMESTKGTQL